LALENEFVVKESKNNFLQKISASSDIAPKCTFDRIPMERIFANSTRFRNKLGCSLLASLVLTVWNVTDTLGYHTVIAVVNIN
jgi:hypothetical protein